jgi:hypothetical protein
MQVETAAGTLLESPYGIHSLIVYSDLVTLQEFVSFYTKKSIEEKEEVVCLATFYETIESVKKTLAEEGHMPLDVQKYEKEQKSLIIVDSLKKYLDSKANRIFDVKSAVNANHILVDYAKSLNKKGVSILGDMGAFLFMNQIQNLVDYELALPDEFDVNLKGVCLYHYRDFDRLPENQKKKIIKKHRIAIKI